MQLETWRTLSIFPECRCGGELFRTLTGHWASMQAYVMEGLEPDEKVKQKDSEYLLKYMDKYGVDIDCLLPVLASRLSSRFWAFVSFKSLRICRKIMVTRQLLTKTAEKYSGEIWVNYLESIPQREGSKQTKIF
jgi:hypothetical protein